MNVLSQIEPLLLQVQKPAQYIGGEVGSIVKEIQNVDVRFAFAFRIPMRSACPTLA